jgi:2-hydroxychromene-2-carboxylate isomerase
MERECARLGVPFRRPSVFPRNGLAAARVAAAGEGEPWLSAFVRQVYLAQFRDDREIGDLGVLSEALTVAGCPDPDRLLALSATEAVKQTLRARTDEAMALGLFGAPSVIARGELFWGSDRLDQALAWARGT